MATPTLPRPSRPAQTVPSTPKPNATQRARFALVGNPNCGKTTLFNALTGLRHKVGNYPGVTVERKEGSVNLASGQTVDVADLPGLYSLTPHSPDERIARDALLGYIPGQPRPDAVVNVVDASNLERNLYLTSQILDLGLPTLVVLTMTDTAAHQGVQVDADALQKALGGVPVVTVIASRRAGMTELRRALEDLPQTAPPPPRNWKLPQAAEDEVEEMANLLQTHHDLPPASAFSEAILLLGGLPEGDARKKDDPSLLRWSPQVREHLLQDLVALSRQNIDISQVITEARYADVGRMVSRAMRRAEQTPVTLSEKLDKVFLHRVWGYVIFLALMAFLFQAMFSWATFPMDALGAGVDKLSDFVSGIMPPGDLRDLLVKGVLGGVGSTIVFLPQILLLFLFISLLEDTGYLARAAFLMDRLMSRVGLHGKSFIPLLSSYACAIPGIMATRTIDAPRARLLTILVAPLMSCSARLPVYAVMISAFIPPTLLVGFHAGAFKIGLTLPAVVLLSMYTLGTVTAFAIAALFNRTILKGEPPTFLLEMPPYRLPSITTVLYQMVERAWLFLKRAGTLILAISVVLWFLSSYPKSPNGTPNSEKIRHSFAGQLGRAIEPVIAPLGFDWKMGIGIVSSFAAREVFVSAMGTIYNVSDEDAADEEKTSVIVQNKMRSDINPQTGKPTFTPLVAISLMVYYVLAMQCISTVVVVRRETGGWKWPLFQIAYMTVLAWVASFIVYQGGRLLGWG